MSEDPLMAYIEKRSEHCQLALTDRSYRPKYQKMMREKNKGKPKGKQSNEPIPINFELGTLGDAVLRLSLTLMFYENGDELISKKRARYESDKVLITKVAPYYNLRDVLRFDDEDPNKQHGYDYWEYTGDGDHPQKYLATAMEALLGAYYLDHGKDLDKIRPVVKKWIEIIGEE